MESAGGPQLISSNYTDEEFYSKQTTASLPTRLGEFTLPHNLSHITPQTLVSAGSVAAHESEWGLLLEQSSTSQGSGSSEELQVLERSPGRKEHPYVSLTGASLAA